jgi:aryl-alcohol dehydrogenase-like predicted oxidoreductase
LYVATKVPPKNRKWPGTAATPVADVFPYEYIVEMTEKSLRNLGVERIHLQQLHVWDDTWAADEGWQRAAEDLKKAGKIEGFGISVNRWEPANVLQALETGLVDAVQVVYNLFDQNPEDALFPAAQRLDVAILARVPFDEGSLTGRMTRDMTFPSTDWRSLYFTPENLAETLDHVDRLTPDVPAGMTLPELALRFILEHPAVSTTIPGMRKAAHVAENTSVSDGRRLGEGLMAALRAHRWDRTHVIP